MRTFVGCLCSRLVIRVCEAGRDTPDSWFKRAYFMESEVPKPPEGENILLDRIPMADVTVKGHRGAEGLFLRSMGASEPIGS